MENGNTAAGELRSRTQTMSSGPPQRRLLGHPGFFHGTILQMERDSRDALLAIKGWSISG